MSKETFRYLVGCRKQPGLYCGRPRRETGRSAFVRVFGETPFLRAAAMAVDPRCNARDHGRLSVVDDRGFAPVNLPKASSLQREDKPEPWLDQLGRAREPVLAVLDDTDLPGYLRGELAGVALTLGSVVTRLETIHAGELQIGDFRFQRRRKRRSVITSRSRKGGEL